MESKITNLSNNLFNENVYSKKDRKQVADYFIETVNKLFPNEKRLDEESIKLMCKKIGIDDLDGQDIFQDIHFKEKFKDAISRIDESNINSPYLSKYFYATRNEKILEQNNHVHPRIIDLFCGSGGLSLGFNQLGFRTAFANDVDRDALRTYMFNRPGDDAKHVVLGDITKIVDDIDDYIDLNSEVDVIAGGPPCQGFSNANRQRIINDPRNVLYKYFVKAIHRIKPKFFVMENVRGMMKVQDQIIKDFNSSNDVEYSISCQIFNAKNFGIPQNRERLIFIGVRSDISELVGKNSADIFMELNGMDVDKNVPLQLALEGLRPLEASTKKNSTVVGDDVSGYIIDKNTNKKDNEYIQKINMGKRNELVFNHKARFNNDRDIKIYGLMKQGDRSDSPRIKDLMPYKSRSDIFKDKYFKLKNDTICKTITAHMKFDCNMYIHPTQARGLTPREAARVQSYPDDYLFLGPYTKTYQQVGNSVPPLLSKSIAGKIYDVLKDYNSSR